MAHGSRTNLPRSRGNTDLSQASTSLATLSLATFSRAASAALRRKHWRKSLKRAVFVAVVLVTNLSLLVAQTQAYREIHQQIHAPARVSLGAGPLDYVSNAVSKVAGELMRSLANMTTALLSTDGGRLQGTTLSPAGRPLPWQAAVPAAPFSTVNMARANVFTEVPIIDWQPLGRPVAFSLFHNTLGSEPATVTLPEKWTHAYSRHLAYDLGEDVYTLYTDEGGSIPFTAKPGVPDTYIPPAGFHMTLERDGGQGVLTLTYKNQDKDEFDLATGHLASLLDASGNACVLTYEPDPVHGGQRLYQITDASDNVLELGYNGVTGRLVSIAVPPIGSPDHQLERIYEIDYPTDLPPDVTDIVKVSTARRHPTTEEPLFWAEFHTDGPKLVRIIDYPIKYTLESSPGDPIPADGTPTTITYGTNGHIDLVTLAEGLSEQQTRQFHFYILQLPKVRPLQGKAPPVPPQQLPIYRATVQGARTSPAPDVTDYRFDGSSRLTEVTDPLDRVVTEITWDDDNNPLTTTNVLGGVTTRTFDDRGNVLTVQPPVGGPWEYAYDGLNNLTYMEDPLGHETWFDYEDIANPTRPTRIDGPGVSDLTLEWGQGTDGGRDLTYDLAKLRRTIGPNGVEQGFRYWPHTGGGHGHGQLMQSTHGRGDFNGDVHSVSDGVSDPDATGNVTSSGMAGYDCGLMWCALPEDSIYPKIEVCSVPNPDAICLYGDRCCVEYDADGNRTSCLDCPGCEGLGEGGEGEDGGGGCDGGRSAVPVLFNGKGQPLSLPQLTSDMGYEFEYDSLGRKKHKEVIATNGEQGAFLEPVLLVFPDYTVSWSYLDDSGRIEREYYRANLDYQDGYVNTMVETDLAGRVECVTQNGSATSYQYTDATALPAVVETKPDNTVSEYYLDLAGQVTKIVHKNAQGAEVLAFQYQRDDKGRVVRIDEYVEQGPEANVTTYEYGDGHLTEGDLDSDSAQAVEPEKLYYSWFSDLMEDSEYFADGGDPNRLVKEVRTGDNEYYNEYRYDAGGNRLCKIEKQNVAMPGEPADWRFAKVIRYNYAYHPNYNPADPREQGNPESDYGLGEPDPGMSPGYSWSYNVYDLSGEGAGQDKLLSYTEYLFDGDGVPVVDQAAIYTMYEWHTSGGQMSRRMSWNGETQTQMDTAFTYNRSRLQSALVDEIRWPTAEEEQEPGFDLGEWITTHGVRFLEVFGYSIFGELVGKTHCTKLMCDGVAYSSNMAYSCSRYVRMYDYVDGQLLVERESDNHNGLHERLDSIYTWSPLGLVAREGVIVREGSWDPDGGPECWDEGQQEVIPQGEFAYGPDTLMYYTYMSDQMGNIAALVDGNPGSATYGEARRQVFDAFGNNVGGYITFLCASDHNFADQAWDPWEPPCPLPPPELLENTDEQRMATGSFNWRGGEGTRTPQVTEYMQDRETWEIRWSAYTRPSTGLIYMVNRYYEPETGRFTQPDPMPFDTLQLVAGQNNRWSYCGNDPANLTDANGLLVGETGRLAFALVLAYLSVPYGLGVMTGFAAAFGCDLMPLANALFGLFQAALSKYKAQICKNVLKNRQVQMRILKNMALKLGLTAGGLGVVSLGDTFAMLQAIGFVHIACITGTTPSFYAGYQAGYIAALEWDWP